MDLTYYIDAAIQGVPLVAVIVVLVQWLKAFKNADGSQKITGNGLLVASFAIGLIFGLAYSVFKLRPPMGGDWYGGYQYWLGAGVYGIVLGGLAAGAFETLKAIFEKAVETFFTKGVGRSIGNGLE